MIEIIPNWHPVFVHFSIGLLSISALFHLVAVTNSKSTNYYQFESVANWNLWLGALFALVTIIAGWFAYNSVEHDTPSHLAMTDHKNWGLGTAVFFIVLAIWSFQRARKSIPISWGLAVLMLVASALLATTGWKGGELVYRHGLGVMSLPEKSEHDHQAHDHGDPGSDSHHDNLDGESGLPMPESKLEGEHEIGESDHGHENHDHNDSNDVEKDTEDKQELPTTDSAKEKSDGHAHDHGDHSH